MKNNARSLALLCLAGWIVFTPTVLRAQDRIVLKGTVADSAQTIPYASVYLKNHPGKGVQSTPEGTFVLPVDRTLLPDTLIVSFVGYHPFRLPLTREQNDTVAVEAVLRQSVIELLGPVVTAKAKRKYKVETGDLLSRIRAQMDKDFADIRAVYRVQTNTSISSSDKILAYQENLVDTYDPGPGEKDRTRRLKTRVYFDTLAYRRMQQVDTLRHLDPTVNIKGLTVSIGTIRRILNEKDRKWEYLGQMDGEIVLTYYDMFRFLKMFSLGEQYVLYVDSRTLSLNRAEAIMSVYVNIPFGKNLPEELLPMVNVLNIDPKEFNKFRVKKMDGEFRMSSRFVRRGESLYRGDSYSHGQAVISGGGRRPALFIGLKSETRILEIATENIVPITDRQTEEQPELILVNDL